MFRSCASLMSTRAWPVETNCNWYQVPTTTAWLEIQTFCGLKQCSTGANVKTAKYLVGLTPAETATRLSMLRLYIYILCISIYIHSYIYISIYIYIYSCLYYFNYINHIHQVYIYIYIYICKYIYLSIYIYI